MSNETITVVEYTFEQHEIWFTGSSDIRDSFIATSKRLDADVDFFLSDSQVQHAFNTIQAMANRHSLDKDKSLSIPILVDLFDIPLTCTGTVRYKPDEIGLIDFNVYLAGTNITNRLTKTELDEIKTNFLEMNLGI